MLLMNSKCSRKYCRSLMLDIVKKRTPYSPEHWHDRFYTTTALTPALLHFSFLFYVSRILSIFLFFFLAASQNLPLPPQPLLSFLVRCSLKHDVGRWLDPLSSRFTLFSYLSFALSHWFLPRASYLSSFYPSCMTLPRSGERTAATGPRGYILRCLCARLMYSRINIW